MKNLSRRNFIKLGGTAAFFSFVPQMCKPKTPFYQEISQQKHSVQYFSANPSVQFLKDGLFLTPEQYSEVISEITADTSFVQDRYAKGGVVEKLEKEFTKITGKESAIFMPSGTMANQLAIRVLSEGKPKVFVQETSHVYRDEADAAQFLHNKRLMPLGKGKGSFTLDELKKAITYFRKNEVFHTEIGAISIENPVRRMYEEVFNIKEIRRISKFAGENNIKMHLDGARLYMASAYSGISIGEYASYFDTVYISLYKYLGAGAGAMLCGSKDVIDKVRNLVKICGGNMFRNWQYAGVALHFLDGFEQRFANAKQKAEDLFKRLNKLDGIRVEKISNGSNVHKLFISGINIDKFRKYLSKKRNIFISRIDKEKGFIPIKVNESQLKISNDYLVESFRSAYGFAATKNKNMRVVS